MAKWLGHTLASMELVLGTAECRQTTGRCWVSLEFCRSSAYP